MKLSIFLAFIGTVLTQQKCHEEPEPPQTYTFPNILKDDPVNITWKPAHSPCGHGFEALDKPRVLPLPNNATWSRWQFRAVNLDNLAESVQIIFFLGADEFCPLQVDVKGIVSVHVRYSFVEMGGETRINSKEGDEGKVTFKTDQYGSSATWGTTGARWSGNGLADAPTYTVEIDAQGHNIQGTIELTSLSTGRYPCVTVPNLSNDTTLQVLPGVGWTNQIPTAKATANITIRTPGKAEPKKLNFSNGLGYHDYQFGDRPYLSDAKLWQWGHALVTSNSTKPSYSVLWFQGVDIADKKYSGAYVGEAGKDAEAECAGGDSELLKLEDSDDGTYVKIVIKSNVTIDLVIEKPKLWVDYWAGPALATIDGKEWTGAAVVDALKS